MLKTKIGHVTVVDSEESTTIIGITHGLAWENIYSYIGHASWGEGPKMINQYFNVYALRRVRCVALYTPLPDSQKSTGALLCIPQVEECHGRPHGHFTNRSRG